MSRFYLRFQSTVLHCASNITMFKEMSIKENNINVFGAFWMDALQYITMKFMTFVHTHFISAS